MGLNLFIPFLINSFSNKEIEKIFLTYISQILWKSMTNNIYSNKKKSLQYDCLNFITSTFFY